MAILLYWASSLGPQVCEQICQISFSLVKIVLLELIFVR